MLSTRYLFLYNAVMCVGWSAVLVRLLQAISTGSSVYEAVQAPLKIFQTGALLEVIHSVIGLIRAPVATTLLQVSSRLMILWGVTQPVEPVRSNLSFIAMIIAWSLTEIPRYLYFTVASVARHVPSWLTFIRYTTFIPLYPLGASSEWLTLYAALPHIRQSKLFSISLPNYLNFAFNYHYFCVIILTMYIPGLPHMYSHMLRQRKKYVTVPTAKPAKAD
ncbi:Very-long-chain (3R)-3-hydroxyacyl-CoA dehydratase 2 [Gracilariopsis chorda]|uniref:very-long-chain (3R)-3-hydroxyacyl-CoA dehydratase n=1 Tax=Gracilariopsis chorda TaxID=448386 RepID=A0A2V3ITC7_9FLOR|nr:Very-long-chain (3R)-3-hydroxyacyl-CoA dehydratase 2 [Gracilariopsis chorda]|eukprot:PXF45376.1 Very-long-chain (3R)-3-hydroxyacyl-CoA dehydratase 2 [Gracilariopsis chorda]